MSLIAFLGPSLGAAEARRLAPGARLLPPAGRGDLFKALGRGRRKPPRVIALIDGVFEARPAVWHREILAALEEGVAVFGASSMGALRAAELWPFGMVGLGRVYGWLRNGTILDDSEVALLHADREHGYRALSVPLVNVRAAAQVANAKGVLSRTQARGLIAAAAAIFYQDRTWPRVLGALRWNARDRTRFEQVLETERTDVKAEDARTCLIAAAGLAAQPAPMLTTPPLWPEASALVRRQLGDRRVCGTRAELAALARSLGASVDAAGLAAHRGSLREREDAALEAWFRRYAAQLVPGLDG